MPSDAMPLTLSRPRDRVKSISALSAYSAVKGLIPALQAMQNNSLLSFAEIHFPSEMFNLGLMSSQSTLISWMSWSWWMVVPSLVARSFMSLNDLIFTFLNLHVFPQCTASIRSSQSVNAIVLV